MIEIPLEKIRPNPNQPRRRFEGLEELAQSLRDEGQLTPILVRPDDDVYELVNGERRWRAAKLAGLEVLRAEVRELTDEDAYRLSLIENVARDSLTPIEEAEAFRKLTEGGMTQVEVGRLVGKSQQYVADRLALLRLPDKVQSLVTARAVNPSIARRLVTLDDPKAQIRLAKRAAEGNLTVKLIEYEKRYASRVGDLKTYLVTPSLEAMILDSARCKQYIEAVQQGYRAVFNEMVKDAPELAQYAEAVKSKELEVKIGNVNLTNFVNQCARIGPLALKVSLEQEFTGQNWHWPKYSGAAMLIGPGQVGPAKAEGLTLDRWYEDLGIPLFSEQEWFELQKLDECGDWEALGFPGQEWFELPQPEPGSHAIRCSALAQRTYHPDYGRFIVDNSNYDHCQGCPPELLFVWQGWGKWCVVEFNDGLGGRMRRRFFEHGHIGATLIHQAIDTVDPFAFSDYNFKQLKLWQVQPIGASWFYIRRDTIPREEMIAALEEDLARLRNAEPLSDEELMECVLDWLQEYIPPYGDYEWREGTCSYPRRSDGTVDVGRMEELEWA